MSDETREFKLPDLGEGLTEAEIVQWLVKPGDVIELNQPICEVETEKAIVEIPSPFAGEVVSVTGDVGERVAVGATILVVRTGADAPKTGRKEVLVGYGPEDGAGKRRKNRKIGRRVVDDAPPDVAEEIGQQRDLVEKAAEEDAAAASPVRALATPPVRKLAREMNVDIDTLTGTGPKGRVMREDVLAATAGDVAQTPSAPAAATSGEVVRLSSVPRTGAGPAEERIAVRAIRRSIADKMVRSVQSIPHVAEWLQVDATELMRLRADLSASPEATNGKISPLPIAVKALLAALRKHPLINSSWDDATTEIVIKRTYHVGIATDTERGLLVPVVRDADQRTVFEISDEITRLVTAARAGKIGPTDLTGSTITVSNIGSFGMEAGTPIINHPECAVLALGVIAKRPWVVNGEVVPRDVMTLSLSFDHRIVDGAEAGRFLRYLGDLIEKPARLFGVL